MKTTLFFLLNLFIWFILSSDFSIFSVFFGILSSIIVVYLACAAYKNLLQDDGQSKLSPKIFIYIPWLIKEMLLSAVNVSKKIWGLESYNPDFKLINSPLGKEQNFIYANSITLTPGTVAVDLGENTILVHALEKNDLLFMEGGEMERKISRLC